MLTTFVSYYKPYLEKKYMCHPSTFPLSYAERNECVFMVPGSISQMQKEMIADDLYDRLEKEKLDAHWGFEE